MKKLLSVVFVLVMVLAAAMCVQAQGELVVKDESDYVHMTMDELYQEALKEAAEGKTLVAYSNSSSVSKSAALFQEAFPGIPVEGTKIKADALEEKIPLEYEGSPYVDVIVMSDSVGSIYLDWYKKGYVTAYYPDAITDLDPRYSAYGLPITIEGDVWYYNTTAFPDGCPVTNWWDLVEMKEDGTSVYTILVHPISNLSTSSLLTNMVLHADQLEADYLEKYGEPLEYTYPDDLGVEENNAGYEYLYRLSQLKMTFIGDGDEIVEAVANSTSDKPVLGLASAGKIGNRDDNGWPIAWVTELAPYVSGQNTNYSFIVPGTDNPALARFFVRYMMGGDDGSGDGYKQVMKEGAWSVRDDYNNKKNPFTLAESGAVPLNMEGIYENYLDVADFWTYWHDMSPNK